MPNSFQVYFLTLYRCRWISQNLTIMLHYHLSRAPLKWLKGRLKLWTWLKVVNLIAFLLLPYWKWLALLTFLIKAFEKMSIIIEHQLCRPYTQGWKLKCVCSWPPCDLLVTYRQDIFISCTRQSEANFISVLFPSSIGLQHGGSTVTNLDFFEDSILSAFGHFSQVNEIYLCCGNAFDRVSHLLLIMKLKSYGLSNPRYHGFIVILR